MIFKKHLIQAEAVLLIFFMLFSLLFIHPVMAEEIIADEPASEAITTTDPPEKEQLEASIAKKTDEAAPVEENQTKLEVSGQEEAALPAKEAEKNENAPVAKAAIESNGITEVSTLEELINGITSGDVKVMNSIYGVTNTITIPAGHVLDGNGKTISAFTDAGETTENFVMPTDHGLCEMIAVEGTLKNTEVIAPRSIGMGTPYYEPQSTVKPDNYRYDHIAAVHVKAGGALEQSSVKYGKYGVRLSGNAHVSNVWVQQAGQAAFYVYADSPITGDTPAITPSLTNVHVKTEIGVDGADYTYGLGIYIEPKTEYSHQTFKGNNYTQHKEYQDYVKNVKMTISNYKSYSWASEDEFVNSLKAAAGSKEIATLESVGGSAGMGTPQLQAMIRGDGGNPFKLSDDFRHDSDKTINAGAIWFDKKFIGVSPLFSGTAIPFDNIQQSLATAKGNGLSKNWALRYTNITSTTWSVTQQYPGLEAVSMAGDLYQDQIVSTFQSYGKSYGFDVAFHYIGASKANNADAFNTYYTETQPAKFSPIITSTAD